MLLVSTMLQPFYAVFQLLHSIVRSSPGNYAIENSTDYSVVEMETTGVQCEASTDIIGHVVDQFDCIVCFQKMVPPRIGLHCANGHSVCNICWVRLESCPTCRVKKELGLYPCYFQSFLGDKLVEGGYLEPPLPSRTSGVMVQTRTNHSEAPESSRIEGQESQISIGLISTGIIIALDIVSKAIQLIVGIVLFLISCFMVGVFKIVLIVHAVLLLISVLVKMVGHRDVRIDGCFLFVGYAILIVYVTNMASIDISQSTPFFLKDKIESIFGVIYLILPILHLANWQKWLELETRDQSHTDPSNMV